MALSSAHPTSAPVANAHTERERAVAAPQGLLALVGTQWVDSEQTIYDVPGVWAPAPAGESGLLVRAEASASIVIDGTVLDGEATVHGQDADAPSQLVFREGVTGTVIRSEQGTYGLRVWDAASEGVSAFGSIERYPENSAWVIEGRFTAALEESTAGFENFFDNGATRTDIVAGTLTVTIGGTELNLVAYSSRGIVHLVFTDATSGVDTYGVGRFLFGPLGEDGRTTLDFNRAVLPPCAFSYHFNCPIAPPANRLSVAVTAGEKNVLRADGTLLH